MKFFNQLSSILVNSYFHTDSKTPKSWQKIKTNFFSAETLKICSRNSRNLSQCIKDSVEHLKPFLLSGNLGDNVKIIPFEPFTIDDILIDRGQDFKVKMLNVNIMGVANFKLEKLKPDLRNLSIDVLITFPELAYSGNYEMDIKLNVLHVYGKGKFNGTLGESFYEI